ncbi:tRNA-I(6)A37 thiotransferase enzyme MiaB [Cokeromyces recurvatus]|uniref:tRNA-I(6)A37 thiotransferase enzyme MiaB n=1 Tax=Cokeromyces recurvatus TaxID=90255 RepID=UPI00221F667F|nr:tRNA-I(6)A37 thiotransferase enzyme MiaB [Cokeromyces recurvatus]KAI7905665.1 tRNA-I(6)A37 thiotransferase enzyme MiaB [Cokeromyces recurvatus]
MSIFRSIPKCGVSKWQRMLQYRTLATSTAIEQKTAKRRRLVFDNRSPSFQDFLLTQKQSSKPLDPKLTQPDQVPYLHTDSKLLGKGKKFFIEVYGCQMNVNDTEILNSIMTNTGYERTNNLDDANIVFLVTCAIRDNAEVKIWERLKYLRHYRTKINSDNPPIVGVLGCMAERLKTKLLEQDRLVDIVCGPDGYRSIPHLISLAEGEEYSEGIANVMLSADETYADVMPMRLDPANVSGWVSIMRGCNNMCSFCIVPFTRGNERSRPIDSIINEVRYLNDQGVKEVTVLAYRDESESKYFMSNMGLGSNLSNSGFKTIYKRKDGGRRFTELLDKISLINPEMRIRFTSPHPKDFPTDLLHLIASRPNICNSIHLPIQSGSNTVLERMRRGYTREAYLDLVEEMRRIIPNVWISSDIIAGFCGETEEEHQDTVKLMEQVKYDTAFMFAYSMREKTHAHRRYQDDVPENEKIRRLQEIVNTFHREATQKNKKLIGSTQLVLIDSDRPRNKNGIDTKFSGRTDGGHKVFIQEKDGNHDLQKGNYVEVKINHTTSASLTGTFLKHSSIQQFATQRYYSTIARRDTTAIRSRYRTFLKAGNIAVEGVDKRHIKKLIREGFENHQFLYDPEIEIKGIKN